MTTKEYQKQYRLNHKEQAKDYYLENRTEIRKKQNKYKRKWRLLNLEHIKVYNEKHAEEIKDYMLEYRETHKDEKAVLDKNYCQNNKEKILQYAKEYYLENKEIILLKQSVYNKIHSVERTEWARKYIGNKRKTNIEFKVLCNLRKRIWDALKGNSKSARTTKLIGCSINTFLSYYEKKFTEGMTWKKVMSGEIHCDHIKPCASFDLSKPEEQLKCFHYTNLQPLWAKENLSKGKNIKEKP